MKTLWSGRIVNLFLIFLMITITGISIAILMALNMIGLGWAWSLVAILFGIALFFVVGRVSVNEDLLSILESIFPVIGKFKSNQQKRYEYRGVIDKLEYTLEYHNLIKNLNPARIERTPEGGYSFNENFRKHLIKRMGQKKDQTRVDNRCIEDIVVEMEPVYFPIVIKMLNEELHGNKTPKLYDRIKTSQPKLAQLTEILQNGRHLPCWVSLPPVNEAEKIERGFLPSASVEFPYNAENVRSILRGIQSFEVPRVVEEVRKLEKVWRVVTAYLAFLMKNNVLQKEYNIEVSNIVKPEGARAAELFLGNNFSQMLTPEENHILLALLQEAEKAFKSKSAISVPSSAVERASLILTALAMFFTENRLDCPNLKAVVCKLASKQKMAQQQHIAYLEYREDLRQLTELDGLPFVSVKYIAENWKKTIAQLAPTPRFKREMAAIEENLAEGRWWTRLPPFIEELLGNVEQSLRQEINSIKDVIGKYPPVESILRRLFRGLKLETIERLLETRMITAYLFTFDGLKGSLAELIDSLSYFEGGKNRAVLQENKVVKFQYRGKEKYIFKNYTAHSRLGIVPSVMTFDAFHKQFERDLSAVYKKRYLLKLENSEIDDFEMIIHRFGLLGRDRHGFEKFNPGGRRMHALPKIQELLSISLSPEDIIKLMGYEQPPQKDSRVEIEPIIKGILDLGTIRDFLGDEVKGISKSRLQTLADNDQALKMELVSKMGSDSLSGLATLLLADENSKTAASHKLAKLIQRLPGFEDIPSVCKFISTNYTDLLVDIAMLHKKHPAPPAK